MELWQLDVVGGFELADGRREAQAEGITLSPLNRSPYVDMIRVFAVGRFSDCQSRTGSGSLTAESLAWIAAWSTSLWVTVR